MHKKYFSCVHILLSLITFRFYELILNVNSFIKIAFLIVSHLSAAYKSEVEITPTPPLDESTTKKSGFFGGIKNFFRGTPASTTIAPEVSTPKIATKPIVQNVQVPVGPTRPPALIIPQAPLVPIGPRPDTPVSSPWGGNAQEPPQWPQPQNSGATTTTLRPPSHQAQPNVMPNIPVQSNLPSNPQTSLTSNARPSGAQPNLPPSFGTYQPKKPQPSGMDLSYGGGFSRPSSQQPNKPITGLVGTTTTTSTTTTTAKPIQMEIDLRGGFGNNGNKKDIETPANPTLPGIPDQPKTGIKDEFPSLPAPKSPSPTPSSPISPSSPSAWNKPLPTPVSTTGATSTTAKSILPNSPISGGNRVAFVPHSGSTTTVRPGFENTGNSLATDDEIRKLTETLYTKEANTQINYITINAQGKTRSIDSTDEAAQP